MGKKRNLWVIPTNKPSRLQKFINYVVDKIEFELCSKAEFFNKGQHIYITSDEEIKDECWIIPIDGVPYKLVDLAHILKSDRKIILTTDQDLIADGVQAIDDEFLEWFVKNPSCEEVEVDKGYRGVNLFNYKIIIPKEEPKQFVDCKCTNALQVENCIRNCGYREEPKQEYKYIGECNGNNDNGCFLDSPAHDCGCFTRVVKEKPKQETLEEAIKQELENHFFSNISEIKQAEYFINFGARWQQEQDKKMYSEEDIKSAYNEGAFAQLRYRDGEKWIDSNKWFEQFKKK
jgi:hypothetical protein